MSVDQIVESVICLVCGYQFWVSIKKFVQRNANFAPTFLNAFSACVFKIYQHYPVRFFFKMEYLNISYSKGTSLHIMRSFFN